MGLESVLSPIAGFANAGLGVYNYMHQAEQQQYDRRMQKEAWSREDNAVQRRVEDLKAAGLSPVLAAGSAASSSGPIHLSAPRLDANPINTALQTAMGQANIAQTNASRKAVEAQKNKTDAETGILNRERRILNDMDSMESEDGTPVGTLGEAMNRTMTSYYNRVKAEADAKASELNALGASWNLDKAKSRNIPLGQSTISNIADAYDFLQTGNGVKALTLDTVMNIVGSIGNALPRLRGGKR